MNRLENYHEHLWERGFDMNRYYTAEKNIQMLIAIMKAHGIKKVVASPGSTNVTLIASLMYDGSFEMYSAPDERSAAYIACGMAAESCEPVALSCTGATASRNYIPGLTEAYYRKLPILAITSTQHMGQIGQYVPQVIDRTIPLNDIVNLSVQIPIINNDTDAWAVNTKLNEAVLELRHRGGGPVHINLTTSYLVSPIDFSVKTLPATRIINRIQYGDEFPDLEGKKVGIFVGNHKQFSKDEISSIDLFCEKYNSVVLCDHTSNYYGKFAMSASLISAQDTYKSTNLNMDVLVHIGEVSGSYMSFNPKEVWRVSPDGVIRDTFKKLKNVFECSEKFFFDCYNAKKQDIELSNDYYNEWESEYNKLNKNIPELPFSNIWMAQNTFNRIPSGSFLHLGILNSLRAWNFMQIRPDICSFSNTRGFGIDGLMSSLIGAALVNEDKLHFLIIGDLAFFYDMNVLGNRHVSPNLRILLVNNGKGTEFKNYTNFASEFGVETDKYIAAGGHYGNKSKDLVKHYAEDLGFSYIAASSKTEYLEGLDRFTSLDEKEKPILFEVFTDEKDESDALYIMRNLGTTGSLKIKSATKSIVKNVLGENTVSKVKKMLAK